MNTEGFDTIMTHFLIKHIEFNFSMFTSSGIFGRERRYNSSNIEHF